MEQVTERRFHLRDMLRDDIPTKRARHWRSAPLHVTVIFLLAVFCVFSSFGFVSDVFGLGSQPPARFAISVVLTGLFCVGYAASGILLRGRFWKAMLPIFALQFVLSALISNWFPDPPAPANPPDRATEKAHLVSRMAFDGYGIIIGVSLGYIGFVYVFISEGRRYFKSHSEKTQLEAQLAAASEVQQMLLPASGELFPGFRVESIYRPAQQVGGDFFQIMSVADGGLLIVIGDVAGKGLPAAMVVSMLVGAIRVAAEGTHDPALILRALHERLIGRTQGGFSTALAACITRSGEVTLANAGHLSPYMDGLELVSEGALPLGIANVEYGTTRFQLELGSRLTFYSDGVVEATNIQGELFGFERGQAISRASASEIAAAAASFGQEDDITVVTVERVAA